MPPGVRPYRFGPRDRQGLLLGIRTSQVLIVAGVLVVIVGELRSFRTPLRLPLGFVELVLGLAVAFVPVRGRTLDAWAPVIMRYASAALAGGRREVQSPCGGRDARRRCSPRCASSRWQRSKGASERSSMTAGAGTLTGVLVAAGDAFALLRRRGA